MDASEKDKTPMLSGIDFKSDNINDLSSRRLSTRMRSASMSISASYLESAKQENSSMGFTGPSANGIRTSRIQMSGPLFIRHNHEVFFQPPEVAQEEKTIESKLERYTSSNGSGPLFIRHNHEVFFQPPEVAQEEKTIESKLERYTSSNGRDNDDWPLETFRTKNEHLLKSGQLGMCNDPYCTTCPTYYHVKGHLKTSRTSEVIDAKFHNLLYGDAKGCAKRICSLLTHYIPGVMNPHATVVQHWNKFFVISCLFAVFLDPLFFFLLSTMQDNKCIVLNRPMTTTIVVLRSMTDFIYLIHILLQFRLAYVAPESRVMGSGDLVDDPKKIAQNYVLGYFSIDFFILLPFPQIIILWILPVYMGTNNANYAKNLLRTAILVQYIPRLYRFLPLLAGQSPSGFVFESAWANFVMNLLTFILASHVVGSCWYLLGLQRVNQCLQNACHGSKIDGCAKFIDCGHGNDFTEFQKLPTWEQWKNNSDASACFGLESFNYGIYQNAVNLTTQGVGTRYVYSLFWGFQQISTLAGNQVPSYFIWEVLFTMAIIGVGLLLFALLIGNMQNFLQALGSRRLEMSLRRRDVEQWMSHRRLPVELRRQIWEAERFNWAATRGVNEERLMETLPEDLQRDIRRHLFKFVKKVRIFQVLDEPIVDAICERLRTKTYIQGSKILYRSGLVDKMVFIIRGKMESIGEDLTVLPLSEGDVCGEELLTWCLEHSSVNRDGGKTRLLGHRLLSNRLVRCLTNVEAFVLRAADLEDVTSLFARFLRSTLVQGAIRYESPYWRALAARRIQVAWRYRKRRQNRADISSPPHHYLSCSS